MISLGDERMRQAVLDALASGPKDAIELRDALRSRVAWLLRGREGFLHPLLHALVRAGDVALAGVSSHGLVRYAKAPRRPAPAPDLPPPPAEGPAARTARRVASAVRDREARARIQADVRAHLAALDHAGARRAFGAPRAVRALLRRVDRGRRTVLFAEGAGDVVKKLVWHEAPWILGAIVAYFLVKAFVVEVFVIPSGSMEETLLVGDRVVVLKPGGGDEPERWRIVTFERNGVTYVKRVAGLGGEAIALVGGDVYVDGRVARKPPELSAALRRPYRTWRFDRAEDAREWAGDPSADGGKALVYVGPTLFAWGGRSGGQARARDVPLRDVYLSLLADRPAGSTVSLDLLYFLRGKDESVASLSLEVSDEGARLEVQRGGNARWIARTPGVASGRVRLELDLVDGIVTANAGGQGFSRALPAGDAPPPGAWVRPEVRTGGAARPFSLSLDEDLHYTQIGNLAVAPSDGDEDPASYAFRIPKGSIFVLGDNSADSHDSRFTDFGPIPISELIGPVIFRVWPPGRVGSVR